MEYPDDCSITIRYVARKVAAVEDGLVYLEMTSLREHYFWMGGLAYDNSIQDCLSYIL